MCDFHVLPAVSYPCHPVMKGTGDAIAPPCLLGFSHSFPTLNPFFGVITQMGIHYDAFIRTTDAKHEGVVRAILNKVWEKGDIYKAKYEGAHHLTPFSDEGYLLAGSQCLVFIILFCLCLAYHKQACFTAAVVFTELPGQQPSGTPGVSWCRFRVSLRVALRLTMVVAGCMARHFTCLISSCACMAGWYCVGCEAYKDESEMEGDHMCPTHRARCVERSEENYFFALSKYQAQIQARSLSRHTLLVWNSPPPTFLALFELLQGQGHIRVPLRM